MKRHAREYIYIYIYGSEEVDFEMFASKGTMWRENDLLYFHYGVAEEALTLNFGGVDFRIDLARGPGSIDRFRMAGSFGRDPPRRNSCRGSSDSGGPRRAE